MCGKIIRRLKFDNMSAARNMKYISRRLAVTDLNGKEKEYSDVEFFALLGPLVVLGEPGLGKSEIVKEPSLTRDSVYFRASTVLALPAIPSQPLSSRLIVDGLDEVTAYSQGAAIAQILSKIAN